MTLPELSYYQPVIRDVTWTSLKQIATQIANPGPLGLYAFGLTTAFLQVKLCARKSLMYLESECFDRCQSSKLHFIEFDGMFMLICLLVGLQGAVTTITAGQPTKDFTACFAMFYGEHSSNTMVPWQCGIGLKLAVLSVYLSMSCLRGITALISGMAVTPL